MTTSQPLTKENIFPNEDAVKHLDLTTIIKTVTCTDVWLAAEWAQEQIGTLKMSEKQKLNAIMIIEGAFGACRPHIAETIRDKAEPYRYGDTKKKVKQ